MARVVGFKGIGCHHFGEELILPIGDPEIRKSPQRFRLAEKQEAAVP